MLDAKTVVDNLHTRQREPLRVFWVRVPRGRDDFKRELARRRARLPIVPWVLRRPALQHPDSVMSDVLDILNDAREDILAVKDAAARAGGVDLVLLGRADLKAADTSSPIRLPDWFPVAPGETPAVEIEDLTWSARVSLSDPLLALNETKRLLHDIDEALTSRLQGSLQRDRRLMSSLWDRIGPRAAGKRAKCGTCGAALPAPARPGIEDALQGAQARLKAVSNPADYRPSTGHDQPTIVGLLWKHANETAPARVPGTARALAKALRIDDADVDAQDASLAAVLNRPSSPMDPGTRWAFWLIATVRAACQLMTAAAHADDYPGFGAELLQSTSRDLRSFLDNAVVKLRTAEVGR